MVKTRSKSKGLANAMATSQQTISGAAGPCFIFNYQTDLEPLMRANLAGATLFFNGWYDASLLQKINFRGATVYVNGESTSSLKSLSTQSTPRSPSRSPVKRHSDNYRPSESVAIDRYVPSQAHRERGREQMSEDGRLSPVSRLSLDALHRFPGKLKGWQKQNGSDGRVITGGNQQPLGAKSRLAGFTPAAPAPAPRQTPMITPLADPTNLHPSRMRMLDDHSQFTEDSVPAISSVQAPTSGLQIKGRGLRSYSDVTSDIGGDDWVHDRFDSHAQHEMPLRKRSPSASGQETNGKRIRLLSVSSQEDGEVSDTDDPVANNERGIHRLIKREESYEATGELVSNPSAGKEALRVSADSLPDASPLKNIARFARVSEDIVQSKVQWALANKQAAQELKSSGRISNGIAENCARKEKALQELVNKRESIRGDQNKLEAFNKALSHPSHDEASHDGEGVIELASELSLVRAEPKEIVLKKDIMTLEHPVISNRALGDLGGGRDENRWPRISSPIIQEPTRKVRFNLTDVETLIESAKHGD